MDPFACCLRRFVVSFTFSMLLCFIFCVLSLSDVWPKKKLRSKLHEYFYVLYVKFNRKVVLLSERKCLNLKCMQWLN